MFKCSIHASSDFRYVMPKNFNFQSLITLKHEMDDGQKKTPKKGTEINFKVDFRGHFSSSKRFFALDLEVKENI